MEVLGSRFIRERCKLDLKRFSYLSDDTLTTLENLAEAAAIISAVILLLLFLGTDDLSARRLKSSGWKNCYYYYWDI